MSEERKALDIIQDFRRGFIQNKEWVSSINILDNLVKRNEPMKVKYKHDKDMGYFATCNNCQEGDLIDNQEYCHTCGQKLNWSD